VAQWAEAAKEAAGRAWPAWVIFYHGYITVISPRTIEY
jgi:hypothetical protein